MTELDRLDLEPGLVNGQARVGDFPSILFGGERATLSGGEEPPFFRDLNLDQVVESLLAGRDQYDLRSFFYEPLRDVEAVTYRHEVFRDLELDGVRVAVAAFCTGMERVRRYLTLSEKQRYKYEKERWFLDAAAAYCDAVSQLHSWARRRRPGLPRLQGSARLPLDLHGVGTLQVIEVERHQRAGQSGARDVCAADQGRAGDGQHLPG